MTGHKKEVQPGVWRLRASAGKDPVTGKYKYLHKTVGSSTITRVATGSTTVAVVSAAFTGSTPLYAR